MDIGNPQIASLSARIEELIAYCDKLKHENARLKEGNEELTRTVAEKDEQIEELSETVKSLKAARTLVGISDGTKDARKKVDHLVHEIDRCIGKLNE